MQNWTILVLFWFSLAVEPITANFAAAATGIYYLPVSVGEEFGYSSTRSSAQASQTGSKVSAGAGAVIGGVLFHVPSGCWQN